MSFVNPEEQRKYRMLRAGDFEGVLKYVIHCRLTESLITGWAYDERVKEFKDAMRSTNKEWDESFEIRIDDLLYNLDKLLGDFRTIIYDLAQKKKNTEDKTNGKTTKQ